MEPTSGTVAASAAAGGAPVLRFRNYVPHDAALVPAVQAPLLPEARIPKPATAAGVGDEATASVEGAAAAASDALEARSVSASTPAAVEDNITVAPRKPNWDLKRDVEKRLELLERKTQRAVMELLREKIAASGGGAAAASATTTAGGGGDLMGAELAQAVAAHGAPEARAYDADEIDLE